MREIENKQDWDRCVRDLKINVRGDEAIFDVCRIPHKIDGQFQAERFLPSGDYVTGEIYESDEFEFREITDEHTLGKDPDEFFDFLCETYGTPFLIFDYSGYNEWLV